MFQYPDNQLEMPDAVQNALGSFWDKLYGDRETVNTYCAGKGQIELQTYQDLTDSGLACGIQTCPIYRRVRWLPLTVKKSAVTVLPDSWQITTPTALAKVNVICSHVSSPAVVWIHGVDYTLYNGVLTFQYDPFQAGYPVTSIYDQTGVHVDDELTLWLFRADVDTDMLYEHFGHVFGLKLPSSLGYKRLLMAAWNALVQGTTTGDVALALSSLVDVQLTANDGEIVNYVTRDKDDLLVITNMNVYRFPSNANALVEPNQILSIGQPLTDILQLFDMSTGKTPDLASLSIGSGYLDPSITGHIIFRAADVSTTVTTAADGHTVITFPLDGDAASVSRFWALIDQKGVTSGRTLARAMDLRTNKTGEPTANNLPRTVNPLTFLSQNVLRYNSVLVVMRPEAFGPDAVGLSQFNLVRRMMSPHQAIIPVQLTATNDGITMDGLT